LRSGAEAEKKRSTEMRMNYKWVTRLFSHKEEKKTRREASVEAAERRMMN
jgi:hypothetical protein